MTVSAFDRDIADPHMSWHYAGPAKTLLFNSSQVIRVLSTTSRTRGVVMNHTMEVDDTHRV
jgi:hypothetical protein